MINHVRTLLLNRSNALAGTDSGLPYAELIDPGFAPIALPTDLLALRNAFIPAGSSAEQELVCVAYWLHVLHMPELEPYTLRFDTRYTYDLDEYLSATPARTVTDALTALQGLSLSSGIIPVAFAPWDAAVDLPVLQQTWQQSPESLMRVGSVLLGYAWQCERLRLGVPRPTALKRVT